MDIRKQRFGRLVVIKRIGTDKHRNIIWLCECDCGNETEVTTNKLKKGHTTSCGCYHKEIIHNLMKKYDNPTIISAKGYRSPEYNTWGSMLNRCYNKKHNHYAYYGGRGISVCNRWRYGENGCLGFDLFMEDMGIKPSPQHSIDRINNDGNYEPDNCRWATKKQQVENRRSTG